jgi:hypothetical protein
MALTRIATWKDTLKAAILLEVDGRLLQLSHSALPMHNIERQASTSNVALPNIFVHVNRDGSLALATGMEPDIWPEDEPDV